MYFSLDFYICVLDVVGTTGAGNLSSFKTRVDMRAGVADGVGEIVEVVRRVEMKRRWEVKGKR